MKIGQYLVKLWARVKCLVFFDSQCSLKTTELLCEMVLKLGRFNANNILVTLSVPL